MVATSWSYHLCITSLNPLQFISSYVTVYHMCVCVCVCVCVCLPIYLVYGIWLRSYLNGLVVFPTFFNLSLNLAIRSSWSEPQSAPGLVFADCIEFLHLWLQIIIINLISVLTIWWCPCVESSLVLLEAGALLWPVHSLGKTLLTFAQLHEGHLFWY